MFDVSDPFGHFTGLIRPPIDLEVVRLLNVLADRDRNIDISTARVFAMNHRDGVGVLVKVQNDLEASHVKGISIPDPGYAGWTLRPLSDADFAVWSSPPAAPEIHHRQERARAFSWLLPKKIREEVFDPEFADILILWEERCPSPTPWIRRWARVCITFRCTVLYLACLREWWKGMIWSTIRMWRKPRAKPPPR